MDAKACMAGFQVSPSVDEPLRCVIDTDTSSAPPAEQFDLFCSWYEGISEIKLLEEKGKGFLVRQKAWDFGGFTLLHLEADTVHYSWQSLRRPVMDNWAVHLQLPRSRRSGGYPEVGDLNMDCCALPYRNVSRNSNILALLLPNDLHFFRSSRARLRDDLKQFLVDYMLLLHRSLPHLTVGDMPHIAAATTSMLAAAVEPSRDHFSEVQGAMDTVFAARIARIVMGSLGDPRLTPEMLCRAAGISRSRLYRILAPAGGVSNYIRRRRLLGTHDALANASDQRTITAIAEEFGFTDASTFSRMFRKEFGMSPTEARELGWRGIKHATWIKIEQPMNDRITLNNLLMNNTLGLGQARIVREDCSNSDFRLRPSAVPIGR